MNRIYPFICNHCDFKFEISYDWNKIQGYKPKCPICNKTKEVSRDYQEQNVIIDDGVPKTVGGLADRNAQKKKIK